MSSVYTRIDGSRIMFSQIGYACFVSVMGRALRDVNTLFAWTGNSALSVAFTPNIVNVLALFAIALVFLNKTQRRMGFTSNLVSTLLLSSGFLLAFFANITSVGWMPLVVLCGVLFGIGAAIGMLGWVQTLWAEGRRGVFEILSASLFACVISFAVDTVGSIQSVILVCVGLLVFSTICAFELASPRLYVPLDDVDAKLEFRGREAFNDVFSSVWPSALCIGTLGFMSALARGMVAAQNISIMVGITMVGETVSCFVLILLYSRGLMGANATSLYKVLFPLGALSYLVLVFAGGTFVVFLAAISEFSFTMCSIVMAIQSIDLCRKLSVSPVAIYGLFSSIVHAVLTMGYFFVPLIGDGTSESAYAIIAAIALFVLAMVSQLILRRRTDMAMLTIELDSQTAGSDASEFVMPEQLAQIDLSSREQQVLGLILQGRDVPFIAEELGISKNTVRTHVKSLYTKLDVHSRQEFISLFRKPS